MTHFDFEYRHTTEEVRWVNSKVAVEWQRARSAHKNLTEPQLLEGFMIQHEVSDFDWQRAFS